MPNKVVVGHQVDKTTQATWFLQGFNKRILDKLQGIADHSVLMDIDSVVKAATNVEANLAVAGTQGSEEHAERSDRSDRRWAPPQNLIKGRPHTRALGAKGLTGDQIRTGPDTQAAAMLAAAWAIGLVNAHP